MFRLTRRRRGKERDCQQDADNGDDPASSSSATRNFPPADSADPCSPARVSRRVTTPFFELLEREVERKGFPSSLSSSLVSFGVEHHLSRVPLSPFFLSCWRGVRKQRSRRTWFLLSRPRTSEKKFRTRLRRYSGEQDSFQSRSPPD